MKKILYCCYRFDRKGTKQYDIGTLSLQRKSSIRELLRWSSMTWEEVKKSGWNCEKVSVTIDLVEIKGK